MNEPTLMNRDNATPGTSLGEWRITPSKSQIFMFSAITWNRHQIHFNADQAKSEGFPDIVVQRGLIGNFLARFVTEWAGRHGHLERLRWKVLRSAFPGQELRCGGEITRIESEDIDGNKRAECMIRVLNPDGLQVAEGEARVRLAHPRTSRSGDRDR